MKIETSAIIEAYEKGQSINSIAKAFGTYPTSIRRILERNNVELRHDSRKKGELYVQDGEKLLEWVKAQGRLVTKTELAAIIGKSNVGKSTLINKLVGEKVAITVNKSQTTRTAIRAIVNREHSQIILL